MNQAQPLNVPPTRRQRQVPRVALLAGVMLVAALLRIYMADRFSFWFDEILTAIDIQYYYHNFFIDRAGVSQFSLWSWDHPPLYFILTKHFTDWFGHNEFAFRFVALIAGTLTVLALYGLGKELFGPWTGLIAALLLAVSAFHVRYTQEARPYALMMLANVVSYWCLARALKTEKPAYGAWLGWAAANIVGFYTHYLSVAVWASQMIVADLARTSRKQFIWLLLASAVVWAAFLPWLDNFLEFLDKPLGGGPATRTQLARIVYRLLVQELAFDRTWFFWVGVTLIVLALIVRRDARLRGIFLLILVGGTAQLAVYFVDPTSRLFGARYILSLLPLWLLMLAQATVVVTTWGHRQAVRLQPIPDTRVSYRRLGLAAAIVPTGVVLIYLGLAAVDLVDYYRTPREDFKGAASYIRDHLLPGEPVLTDARHYGYPGVLEYYPTRLGYQQHLWVEQFDVERVTAMCVDSQRAWYWTRIRDHATIYQDPVAAWLDANGNCGHSDQYPGFLICSCGATPDAVAAAATPNNALLTRAHANRVLGNWELATGLYLEAIATEADPASALQGLQILGQLTGDPLLEIHALHRQLWLTPDNPGIGGALKQAFTTYFTQSPAALDQVIETAPNLLPHGSFEEGNPFIVPGGETIRADAIFEVDHTVARTGSASLKVEGLTAQYHDGWSHQVPITGNVPFLLAGYVKSEDAAGLKARVLYWENNGSSHLGWKTLTGTMEPWTFFWTIALIPRHQYVLNVRPALFEGVGTIWMDDLVLINLLEAVESGPPALAQTP